jgi:pimeloyl-ACP methyl ester carboxylesterase
MASTGVSLSDILRFQVRQAFANANLDSSLIEDEIAAREKLMEAVVKNSEIEQARMNYQHIFKNVQLSLGTDSTQASNLAKQQAGQLVQTFQSPQMKSLLFYDPSTDLQKLNIPVLVLFGRKDTQVTTEMNKSPIETALDSAGVSYQTKVFEYANHLFQKAETGSVQEYGTLGNEFVDGFIETITDWLKNKH